MSISSQHDSLVDLIVGWVRKNYGCADGLYVFADQPGSPTGTKPWLIGGHRPDVYAGILQQDLVIIGEAKCAIDLETTRTKRQLSAFVEHAKQLATAMLVIATPLVCVPSARSIIRMILREHQAEKVNVTYLFL